MGRLSLLGVGFVLSACSTGSFPFRYYALRADSYMGTLAGPTESDDTLLERCKPTEWDKAPCVVVFTPDFLRIKENYLKCQRGAE